MELNPDITTAAAVIRETERDDPDGRDTEESVIIALLMDGVSALDVLKLRQTYLKETRKVLYGDIELQE